MIIPLILKQKYMQYKPFVDEVANRVKPTLINYCERNNYAFTSRIKTLESVAEKIETGRFGSWTQIDDLFACTVIVPTLADEQKVIKYFRDVYEFVTMNKRGQAKKAPEVFRFDSTRIIFRLKRPDGLNEDDMLSIFSVCFELQVRSAFEHAWSVTTHALTYKSPTIDWKRLRLASQIKATVEQLDTLILSFDEATPYISENPWPEIGTKRLIIQSFKSLLDEGYIPSELAPKDLSRFCDNLYSLLKTNIEEKQLGNVLKILKRHLISEGADKVPRSISLLQFVTGLLIRLGLARPPQTKFYLHVTPELLSLFPELNGVENVFNYGNV